MLCCNRFRTCNLLFFVRVVVTESPFSEHRVFKRIEQRKNSRYSSLRPRVCQEAPKMFPRIGSVPARRFARSPRAFTTDHSLACAPIRTGLNEKSHSTLFYTWLQLSAHTKIGQLPLRLASRDQPPRQFLNMATEVIPLVRNKT